ncbi:hypothetical protein D9M71_434060 [compost metagenome]
MFPFYEKLNMQDLRQWSFIADMNHSGSITIGDIWLWCDWLFYYPGDTLILFLINHAPPKFIQFFEITYNSYGGPFSGVISGVVFLFIFGALSLGSAD